MLSTASFPLLAQYYPSTFQTLCQLLLLSFTITPKVSRLAFFVSSFRLPPHLDPYMQTWLPPSVSGILNRFQKLSSQCSIYKPAASLQDHKAVFSSLSLWQSHQLHASKHVHLGICMSVHANTHIHIKKHTHLHLAYPRNKS